MPFRQFEIYIELLQLTEVPGPGATVVRLGLKTFSSGRWSEPILRPCLWHDYAAVEAARQAETGWRNFEKRVWQDVHIDGSGKCRALILRAGKTKTGTLRVIPVGQRLTAVLEMLRTDPDGDRFTKALVAVAIEIVNQRRGRIRLRRLGEASAATLTAFVQDVIEPRSHVHTDGWSGYDSLATAGLSPSRDVSAGAGESVAVAAHAPRPSGRLAAQTVAARHASGRRSATNISTTTSTSSRSGSTGAARAAGASCSTASCSRPWRSNRHRTNRWSSTPECADPRPQHLGLPESSK